MRDYFNVYVTFPLSQERGVNTMYTYVNNRFGTLQGMSSLLSGSARENTSSQLIMETDEVRDYVVENTPVEEGNLWRTLVIAVPNSTDYESNTVYCNGGPNIAICPPSEQAYPRDTRGVIQHEAGGHAFAYLGDEAIVRNAFAPATVKKEVEDKHTWEWYPNLATTGKLHSVPWEEFIFDLDYNDRFWLTLTGPMNNQPDPGWITNYLWTGDWNCFCLRRNFTLPSVSVGEYFLHIANDDGIKVWINGQLVVDFNGWTHDFYQYEVPSSVFVRGNNVIAIWIMQDVGDTDLDYGLWFEPHTPVNSISLSHKTLTLAGGERASLTATVLPEDAWKREITWSVSNPTVASVSSNGTVRGLKTGTTIVRATANDGSGVSAACIVTVTSDYVGTNDLPNRPFEFYFNAAEYDATSHSIPNHPDANLNDASLQLTENLPDFVDGKLLRINER